MILPIFIGLDFKFIIQELYIMKITNLVRSAGRTGFYFDKLWAVMIVCIIADIKFLPR